MPIPARPEDEQQQAIRNRLALTTQAPSKEDVPWLLEKLDATEAARVALQQQVEGGEAIDAPLLAWAVVNCHMLARRALARTTSAYDREKWEHVLRICEKAGARSQGVLRASVPTEMTDGAGQ